MTGIVVGEDRGRHLLIWHDPPGLSDDAVLTLWRLAQWRHQRPGAAPFGLGCASLTALTELGPDRTRAALHELAARRLIHARPDRWDPDMSRWQTYEPPLT